VLRKTERGREGERGGEREREGERGRERCTKSSSSSGYVHLIDEATRLLLDTVTAPAPASATVR
jgi:hypothetical protein